MPLAGLLGKLYAEGQRPRQGRRAKNRLQYDQNQDFCAQRREVFSPLNAIGMSALAGGNRGRRRRRRLERTG